MFSEFLECGANIASITTAVIAGIAYGRYSLDKREKRLRLENYLKQEKVTRKDQGQRSVMHLVAELGMTETEIIDAAFKSQHIVRKVTADMIGAASKLLLEYSESKVN